MNRALDSVAAERLRQINVEGWTPEHDDGHATGEIAAMAAFYAMPEGARDWPASETGYGQTFGEAIIPEGWSAKTGDRRRELVKAGALILAEIERLDREDGLPDIECHGLDTPDRVCFYEQDFYVLSNFSAFSLEWQSIRFDTSEAAYHWEKFDPQSKVANDIRYAISAHEAFKIAERNKDHRRPDWDAVKVDIMRNILRAKVAQHEYVYRKLLATGNRELVENSWRDDYWGWGPNKDGQNMLGKLWMEVRAELRAAATA